MRRVSISSLFAWLWVALSPRRPFHRGGGLEARASAIFHLFHVTQSYSVSRCNSSVVLCRNGSCFYQISLCTPHHSSPHHHGAVDLSNGPLSGHKACSKIAENSWDNPVRLMHDKSTCPFANTSPTSLRYQIPNIYWYFRHSYLICRTSHSYRSRPQNSCCSFTGLRISSLNYTNEENNSLGILNNSVGLDHDCVSAFHLDWNPGFNSGNIWDTTGPCRSYFWVSFCEPVDFQ